MKWSVNRLNPLQNEWNRALYLEPGKRTELGSQKISQWPVRPESFTKKVPQDHSLSSYSAQARLHHHRLPPSAQLRFPSVKTLFPLAGGARRKVSRKAKTILAPLPGYQNSTRALGSTGTMPWIDGCGLYAFFQQIFTHWPVMYFFILTYMVQNIEYP